jgi:UDP-3-O-[3-hydroxymyristoyl] glucosamine N-acyltransferase
MGVFVGDGTVIGRGVTVENDTTIGSRTKIQTGAYITAYVTIEDDVFIAPMVVTTNDNFMGRTEARFEHLKGCTIRKGARVGGGSPGGRPVHPARAVPGRAGGG